MAGASYSNPVARQAPCIPQSAGHLPASPASPRGPRLPLLLGNDLSMAQYRVRVRSAGDEAMGGPEAALTDALVRRFLLRAGFLTSSARAEREAREFAVAFLHRLSRNMLALAQHDRRAGFRLHDVLRACKHFGLTIYGYDDLVALPSPDRGGHDQVFHVTELVECATTFSRAQSSHGEPDLEPAHGPRRHQRTDFVANYASWERDDDDEGSDPELSDWSCFSDSEMEDVDSDSDEQSDCQQQQQERKQSPWRVSAAGRAMRPWHRGKTDEDKFVDALRSAQQVVDAELAVEHEPETEDMEPDAPLGQGYHSDCDDNQEHRLRSRRRRAVVDEDSLWDTAGEIHDVDSARAPAASFENDGNQYVMPRASFAALFQAVLRESMHVGELSISAVALSALHNTTEQYLHRALSEEGSLRYKLQAILMEHEFVRATTHLQAQLQAERDQVLVHAQAVSDLQAALTAKDLEMQEQIARLQRQVAAATAKQPAESSDVEMRTPTPKKRKKSPGKQRKVSSKASAQVVRKDKSPPQPARASQSLVGSLRSRLQDLSRSKKARVNPV